MRLVVFLDSSRDGRMLLLQQRIFATHAALKFRKFADNFGRKIGLRENSGAHCQRWISANQRGDFTRKILDPGDAFALRAELGMEGDIESIEPRHALVEWLLEIKIELDRGRR